MAKFMVSVKTSGKWETIVDTKGEIRTSSSAQDLLDEFKANNANSKIQIAEILTVDDDTGVITGGSISDSFAIRELLKKELPFVPSGA